MVSSHEDIFISSKTCFAAEVGLSGEVRAVNRIEQRILEAEKLGFEKIFISTYNMKGLSREKFQIEIKDINKIDDVFSEIFG